MCDETGTLATPYGVIVRRSKAEDFAEVARLVEVLCVEAVVVGLPLSLDGSVGPQARRVERYARALAEAIDVPVCLHDETYSTVTADELLAQSGRRQRVPIDAAAAAVILQDYLEESVSGCARGLEPERTATTSDSGNDDWGGN